MARALMEKHNGEVPSDMNALLDLPGVGRKTANVIRSVAFGKSALAVDTHVYRVAHRLGLVSKQENTPYKVEPGQTPSASAVACHNGKVGSLVILYQR